jgi:hypothetical protein
VYSGSRIPVHYGCKLLTAAATFYVHVTLL